MKILYPCILSLLTASATISQTTTITITTGSEWTDAALIKSLKPSESQMAATNYNNYPRIASTAWTHSGYQISYRSLMKFDLSTIPAGTVVLSATLYLNSDPANTSGEISNQPLSGSNAFFIEKVTQSWSATTVTWNNQPATTTTNRVWVGQSTSSTENITVSLTTLVQEMVNNPAANYGLRMKLENEVYYRSRSYASTDHTNSVLRPKLVIVLSTPPSLSDAYKTEIESIFQNVNRSYVTTGFLSDYGIFMTNLEKFNGIPSDSNYLAYKEWESLYVTLFTCRFNANSVMNAPVLVTDLVDSLAAQNFNAQFLVAMHYRYERFRDDAVTSNLVYISNNKIYDTPNRPQSPYELRDAFAVVPKRSVLVGYSHNFLFKPELFFTNTGKTISVITFDAGDGLGYRSMTFNNVISVTYPSVGEKVMRFKITYTDNSFMESRTKVLVQFLPQAGSQFRSPDHDSTFLFTATKTFSSPDDSSPIAGKALITVSFANTDKIMRRPFIVVEGFDAWNVKPIKDPNLNYSFEDFLSPDEGIGLFINYTFKVTSYLTLRDAIEGEDFDIVFVDFSIGTDWIQRNAFMVENLIEWVNSVKQPYNGVMQKNIVMGASMGGLVARYALRDMELTTGMASHDTKLLITFDSPHQGVNLPLSLQAMITHWFGKGFGLGVPGIATYTPSWTTFGGIDEDLRRGYRILNSPAARQMLKYSIVGSGDATIHNNSKHDVFIKEYTTMGWPVLGEIKTAAIASGSECGINQGFMPYAEFANADERAWKWGWNILLGLTGFPFIMEYPQAGLAILPGTTDLRQKVIMNALPNQTNQRVYYGKLYIKKKVLFVIPMNITLFVKEVYSRPNYLPLDNAPGGTQNMKGWGKLPFELKDSLFCFVPTYSALDVGGGQQTIAYADVFKAYSPAKPPVPPKNVKAANFFTNPSESNMTNAFHVQITKRNGIWLFQEMVGEIANFSCAEGCNDPSIQPLISGPLSVCDSNSSFTLTNGPFNPSLSWSNSPNLQYVSGQNTNNYVVKRSATGGASVSATYTGMCTSTVTITKSTWAGPPAAIINGPATVYPGQVYDYTAGLADGSYNFGWQVYGNGSIFGGGTPNSLVNVWWDGDGIVELTATNSCGITTSTLNVTSDPGGGCDPCQRMRKDEPAGEVEIMVGSIVAFPNPSAEIFTIALHPEIEINSSISVLVYDASGRMAKKITVNKHVFELDMKGCSNGLYYLKVVSDKEDLALRIQKN